MKRLRAMIIKEFIQMSRDRLTMALMALMPVVQLIIFGLAINTEVKHLATAVFDQSMSSESRDFLSSMQGTGYFDIIKYVESFASIEEEIQSGRAKVGVIFPPDYSEKLGHGAVATVQVIVDASDSMSSSSAISAAQLLGSSKSQEILMKRIQANMDKPLDVRIRAWYNPDLLSPNYMVPGILGTILTMTMIMLTAIGIVREREQGTLEQLLVTPMRTWELILGKILPYIIVGYVQLTLGLFVGDFVFQVPFKGSVHLLYGLTLLFILASLSWGILISSIAKTQMQAMQMSFFAMLPSILLSGFMFPREAMPVIFYDISRILPLTYFLQIVRGIMLKGVNLDNLWPQVFSLSALIVFFLTLSIIKFKKKIA